MDEVEAEIKRFKKLYTSKKRNFTLTTKAISNIIDKSYEDQRLIINKEARSKVTKATEKLKNVHNQLQEVISRLQFLYDVQNDLNIKSDLEKKKLKGEVSKYQNLYAEAHEAIHKIQEEQEAAMEKVKME